MKWIYCKDYFNKNGWILQKLQIQWPGNKLSEVIGLTPDNLYKKDTPLMTSTLYEIYPFWLSSNKSVMSQSHVGWTTLACMLQTYSLNVGS